MTPGTRTKDPTETNFNVNLGECLRARRRILNLSQDAVAINVGVTHQQIARYERGRNAVTVAKLRRLAKTLQIPMGRLVDVAADYDNEADFLRELTRETSDTEQLLTEFARLKQPALRRQILGMVKALADGEDEDDGASNRESP